MVEHGTPFFLSYARAGKNSPPRGKAPDPDRRAEQFFYDLLDDLGQLIYLGPGADLGFMDTTLRGGEKLVPELLRLLGTCQILIPLLSAPYVGSEWCGKEWHAFSCRQPQPLPGATPVPNQQNIIPVRWAPITFDLPAPITEDLIFSPSSDPDPDLPAAYALHGVYGLLQMGRQDSYTNIVWQLSRHIDKVYRSQHLPERIFEPTELENIFESNRHVRPA